MTWLWHFLGFDYGLPYGRVGAYNVWSGFGSDVGQAALIGGAYSLWRKHACHEQGCWRISRHVVNGSPWCNRHHLAARKAHGASQVQAAPHAETLERLAKLSDDVSGLANTVRGVVAVDAQVNAGAGSNPAQGLTADQRVAPPAAAPKPPPVPQSRKPGGAS